jgi:hypothetical protein
MRINGCRRGGTTVIVTRDDAGLKFVVVDEVAIGLRLATGERQHRKGARTLGCRAACRRR